MTALVAPPRPAVLDPSSATLPDSPQWRALHCHLDGPAAVVDGHLRDVVGPLLDRLVAENRLQRWFFVRYAEHGPHLRIRGSGADPATWAALGDRLRAVAPTVDPTPDRPAHWHPHGTVLDSGEHPEARYDAEVARYGGPAAMAVAEDVFAASSALALAVLRADPTRARRLTLAADLAAATAAGLDLPDNTAALWLRTNAFSWRFHASGPSVGGRTGALLQQAQATAETQGPGLARRWAAVGAAVASDQASAAGGGLLAGWAGVVRDARERVETPATVGDPRWLGVWASQLHMLMNRIGLLPDEERSLAWVLASSLLSPAGPQDFHADGATRADRAYLAASGFQRTRIEAQQPRDVPRPAALLDPNPRGVRPLPLPAGPPPAMSLTAALRARQSGRGVLGGPLDATELGTLLWTAHAPTGRPPVRWGAEGEHVHHHRPYPGAGAQYVAKLRVVARDVVGVPSGTYAVDEHARTLIRQADAPSEAELVASSMWFVERPPGGERVVVPGLPLLLGLYVELGALRARYGLRALRFALTEAGHLAQNLALTAAAMGLGLGTLGGFYDDPANEMLCLDGVDDMLVYLIPVGRSSGVPPIPAD